MQSNVRKHNLGNLTAWVETAHVPEFSSLSNQYLLKINMKSSRKIKFPFFCGFCKNFFSYFVVFVARLVGAMSGLKIKSETWSRRKREFFFEQNFPRNDNNCQIVVTFQFWENGSHFQNFPKHKTVQHYLLTSSFDNSILDEVQSMVVDWPEIGWVGLSFFYAL